MPHVTAATSSPLLTVICINHKYHFYNCFHLFGLSNSFMPDWCGFAATTDPSGHTEDCWWLCYYATATTSVWDTFLGLHELCPGPSSSEFSLSELSLPTLSLYLCLLQCLLSVFRFQCGYHVHQWGLNCWDLYHCYPLEYTSGWHVFLPVLVHDPWQVHGVAIPSLLWVGVPQATQLAVLQAFNKYGHTYSFGSSAKFPNSFALSTWSVRVFFSRCCSTWWHSKLWIGGGH